MCQSNYQGRQLLERNRGREGGREGRGRNIREHKMRYCVVKIFPIAYVSWTYTYTYLLIKSFYKLREGRGEGGEREERVCLMDLYLSTNKVFYKMEGGEREEHKRTQDALLRS